MKDDLTAVQSSSTELSNKLESDLKTAEVVFKAHLQIFKLY